MIGEHRIITFGLTDAENDTVRRNFPVQDYELLDTEEPTDLIAISASAIIIYAPTLEQDSMEMIWDFYSEINCNTDETVIWLGEPKPPAELRKCLKSYASFADIEGKLKYLLLDAHTKSKKSSEFSKSILYALRILSEIRKRPGVTSRQLSEQLEISVRSVQRYIETLRCAGEWIEYDTAKKGWKLFDGVSVLFADVKEDEL